MNHSNKIGILGAGAWGTVLAVVAASAGNEVLLWSRRAEVAEAINGAHENAAYLSGVTLSKKIIASQNIGDVTSCDALLLVVPAQTLRENCQMLRDAGLAASVPLVICCKGIEQKTQKLMSEVVADVLPENPVAVLSGPNFAREIAEGLPACATLACADENLGKRLVERLGSKRFRIYYTSDVIGAEVAGAVKNVLAIACGIALGYGLGENARASLVTRGIAEIGRLCKAKGGKCETLMGLSGIGDIMLTCGSLTSRNMSFGYALGQGKTVPGDKLAEGVVTSHSVSELAKSLGVDMPIAAAVNAIIFDKADIGQVVKGLLERPLTVE